MRVDPEREYFERRAREAQASPAYQRHAAEGARERRRAEARERGERLRASALRVIEALDGGKATLVTQLEELIHDVGAGVESLAAWAVAARAHRELTPIELRGVAAALGSARLETVLGRTDWMLQAEPEKRPALLERWRQHDARGQR
ncbi:MAG TPA: hypothetical protein VFV10_04560 [Gammaproteobacteria bacterium]|nr:hypothetical protein [Gammaproteobacteria bacterium]